MLIYYVLCVFVFPRSQAKKLPFLDNYLDLFDPDFGKAAALRTSPNKIDRNCLCGQPNFVRKEDDKIINGVEVAPKYKYPWMAEIKKNNEFHCGGSLINSRFVLSAAHCFIDRDVTLYEVVLGVHNIEAVGSPSEPYVQKRNIQRIKVSGKYNKTSSTSPFDIAILKLNSNVIFTRQINPICLPPYLDVYLLPPRDAGVTGWGQTETGRPSSDVLREVGVTAVNYQQCIAESQYGEIIQPSMICAGAPGKDSCQGDSGGPLMISRAASYAQLGIVSFGAQCASDEYPGVYTSVPTYVNYIYTRTRGGTYCSNPESGHP